MGFIALCVGIIAVAHLPEAVRVGWWIVCEIAKIVWYLAVFAFCIGAFVWLL